MQVHNIRQTTGEEEEEKEIKMSQQEWDKVDQFVIPLKRYF